MNPIIPLHQIRDEDRDYVGGKGFALAAMARNGMNVPDAACVSTKAYTQYVALTGLRERILLELNRKPFEDMRWEEMWDAALRIRNMFLNKPIPEQLAIAIKRPMESIFGHNAVVVRSSAPGEDSSKRSFAGLHESYVNVRGADAILEHMRLVWASLWSDGALLYRQELGLDVETSEMAVVVQEIAAGERSGVAFGRNPTDASQAVIEAVYGLNQGLVDGTVEPDRWILDRETGRVMVHTPAQRDNMVVPSPEGVRLEPLSLDRQNTPPLNREETEEVYRLARRAEDLFGGPQDVEWTFRGDVLHVLQSRPITTGTPDEREDQRTWYLSLRRSFDNLKALRKRIEEDLIPAMGEEATRLAEQDLRTYSDGELADEIDRRSTIHGKWMDVYWSEFIPFAHGARLFGQVYNDAVRPSDPYEFMDLLGATGMASVQRNRKLEHMAARIRNTPGLAEQLRSEDRTLDKPFSILLDEFMDQLGDWSSLMAQGTRERDALIRLLLEMAEHAPTKDRVEPRDIETLTDRFLSHFEGEERAYAAELLDLGRASYRLRDDDNIYLGRIEAQELAAVEEGKCRLRERGDIEADRHSPTDVIELLKDPAYVPKERGPAEASKIDVQMRARQLTG